MGCDIHLYVEKLDRGVWTFVAPQVGKCPDCEGTGEPYHKLESTRCCWSCNGKGLREIDWYEGRNYTLFGVLAGVRGGEAQIDDPRGVPDNMSNTVDEIHWAGAPDIHSHSWFTLKELLDHNWTQYHDEYQSCEHFVVDTLNRLKALGDPAEIRVIFWFDS